jgi:hypothetical protein
MTLLETLQEVDLTYRIHLTHEQRLELEKELESQDHLGYWSRDRALNYFKLPKDWFPAPTTTEISDALAVLG